MIAQRKYRSSSVNVSVDVDISDVLSEMDDADILDEAESRGIGHKIGDEDMCEELLRCLKRGDTQEAIVLLERTLHPKYKSTKLCAAAIATLNSVRGAST